MEILEVLCRRRSDTVENLANEFGVSKRTIKYDIEYLRCLTRYTRFKGMAVAFT